MGLLLVTFYADLGELLWVGATAVKLFFFVIGLALFFRASADVYKARRVASVPLVLLGAGLITFLLVGADIGQRIRFTLVRVHYERRVAEILAAGPASFEKQTRDCEIDEGPPVRIAFYWQRGVIDNWVGLVYDPTGGVMKANEFKSDWSNWEDASLKEGRGCSGAI